LIVRHLAGRDSERPRNYPFCLARYGDMLEVAARRGC
jgi:hypothetical protein